MHRSAAATSVAKEKPLAPETNGKHPFVDGFNGAVVVDVPIGDINPDDLTFQYRFKTRTGALCAAIARQGQEEPVHLTSSIPHRIIDGFQRVNAIRELGWPTVKAFVHHGISDEKAHEIAFTQNVVRKNLSPLEKANAIRLAKKRGCKPAAIAAEFGLSEKQLLRYEKLLDFPKQLQELVDEDEVSMAHAKVLVDFGVTEIVDWVEKTQEKKLSVEDLRRELRATNDTRLKVARRPVAKIGTDDCRIYGRRFSKQTEPEERKRAIAALNQVLAFLERQAETSSNQSSTKHVERPATSRRRRVTQ